MAMKVKNIFIPTGSNQQFANNLVMQLDDLVAKRKQWEATEYKKSNEILYDLLAECHGVFTDKFVKASDSDKKTLRMDLIARLKADGVRVQSNTTTLTMFVRFVFGSDRKRAHGYAYVLKAAISHEVDAKDLPGWLVEQGGIEEVKRRMIVSEKAKQRKADLSAAHQQVQSDIEQAVVSPLAQVKLPHVTGQYAVLLGKPAPDGSLSIVGAISEVDEALLNACLLRMARVKATDNAQTLALSKESSDLLGNSTLVAANDPVVSKEPLAA